MNKMYQGFYWKYNVHCDGVPVPNMGRVFYVVDDFGDLVMVDRASLNFSIS